VVRLADEGMTLPSIRRVLELEDRIRELESECDALREALREARRCLAGPDFAVPGRPSGQPDDQP
jgi:hypothetical protein